MATATKNAPKKTPSRAAPGVRADIVVDDDGQSVRDLPVPDAKTVDKLTAIGTSRHIIVSFDDHHFQLDTQQVLALQGLLNGLCVNLSY